MTGKKKAARKPKPFTLGPWVIAYCTAISGQRQVRFYRNEWRMVTSMASELTRYSRWLLRAAAWVEGGRR